MSNLYSSKPLTKPLKGGSIVSNFGSFDTVSANTLILESVSITGVYEDGIFIGITIQDSELINTTIGLQQPNVGYFTELKTFDDVTFTSNIANTNLIWDPDTGQLYISSTSGSFKVDGCSYLGNLEICRNDVKAINPNGDVNIIPNNIGTINLRGAVNNTSTVGSFSVQMLSGGASIVTSNGITMYSSRGSLAATTDDGQTFMTMNGDISFNVDTATTLRNLTNVRFTSGSIILTTPVYHNLNSGDVVLVSNGSLQGGFTVGSILSTNTVSLTTTTNSSFIQTGGNVIKVANNNIILNTPNLVRIPHDTRLVFGTTSNAVSGSTTGIYINTPVLQIPQNTPLQLGVSSGNFINLSGGTLNVSSNDRIHIASTLTQIDSTNVRFFDPIITLADYTLSSNDLKDRGVEFRYFDPDSNSNKLGWFGFKNATKRFTFITDAINNNEIISGTIGSLELLNLNLTNISINPGGLIDVNCGKLLNVNLITGCSNDLTIAGSTNVTVNATNRIALQAQTDILVPQTVPVLFGTTGSSIRYRNTASVGQFLLTSDRNIELATATRGTIIIPVETGLSFDGTSRGSQRIVSNTVGELIIAGNNAIRLTTTGGNVIVPVNTAIQYGENEQTITGNTSGLTIASSNTGSLVNITAQSGVSVVTSVGDISLIPTSGNGVVRIPESRYLVFSNSTAPSNNSTNSIALSSGNLTILGNSGSSSASILLTNTATINLSASTNVVVPTMTRLELGTGSDKYLYANASNALFLTNTHTSGQLALAASNINLTSGNLTLSNQNTSITSTNLAVSANQFTISPLGSSSRLRINTENVNIQDPIVTIGDAVLLSSDGKDRGIEYRYFNTATTAASLGWFGRKDNTSRFTYYSSAVNTNEVISGTMGDMEISNLFVQRAMNFVNGGFLDLNCGTIANVNTITGCSGVVRVATNSIRLDATSDVTIPSGVPLRFGTVGSTITTDTSGNMTVSTSKVIFNSDVQILGTTTSVSSTVTNIQDPIFSLGGVTGPIIDDNKDRGIEFKWNTGGVSKVGFFGFKDDSGRFVFIPDGVNNNEVFTGAYGDVMFNNAWFANVNLSNGNLQGVNTISGGAITLQSTSGNISITPTRGSSILIPYNTPLAFGTTENAITSDTAGNTTFRSKDDLTLLSTSTVNISTPEAVRFPDNIPLYIGGDNTTYIIRSAGNLNVTASTGNIELTPRYSSGNVNIPTYNHLNFGSTVGTNSTENSIYSDGTQLILNGYQGINMLSSSVTISGDITITGSLTAASGDLDLNKYILPLGTSQICDISSITNVSGTSGNLSIVTVQTNNLRVGDQVTLRSTNSVPSVDGTYTVTFVNSPTSFNITRPATILTTPGTSGKVTSRLTTYQGKDVGIQVDYWSTVGNTSVTAGTLGYKSGFFGFKNDTQRWSFYTNATISNNVVSGNFGDIEVAKVFTTRMSGFGLDGAISAGSNNISGTSFTIGGGTVNATTIGVSSPARGIFTELSNTVQAQLSNVYMQSTLAYSLERYTLNSATLPINNPSANVIVTLFSVSGVNYTTSSGTMPSTSIPDGTYKILMCSSMGTGCSHAIHFGSGKLITPNPLSGTGNATRLVFKRKSQSAHLLFDSIQGAWILLNSGCYVE